MPAANADAGPNDALVRRADAAIDALAGFCDDEQVAASAPLVEALRNARDYPRMSQLAGPIAADAGEPTPRVYVLGHPGGRELSFSFQDNELLGHEGPTYGRPPIEGVCRVHYRAPTEGGSSGSPVFDDHVIALHHMGGQLGMPRLNGDPGSYAANEGIAMSSIVDAVRGSRDADRRAGARRVRRTRRSARSAAAAWHTRYPLAAGPSCGRSSPSSARRRARCR